MAKKRKKTRKRQTKTAAEFARIKDRIRAQERYYQKRGFDTVSVYDTFSGVKASRSSLKELRKYEKQWKEYVADLKREAAKVAREKDVSASIAYKYLAAREREESGHGILQFEDVIIKSFAEKINEFPNYQSRVKMAEFVGRLRSLLGDTEAARVLAETAENEQDFEAVLQYFTDDVALYNTYNLMDLIVNKLDATDYPIAADELRDFMDTLEF